MNFKLRRVPQHTSILGGKSSLHRKNRFKWPTVIRTGQNKKRRSFAYKTY